MNRVRLTIMLAHEQKRILVYLKNLQLTTVDISKDSHTSSKKTINDYRYFTNVYFHDRVPIDDVKK